MAKFPSAKPTARWLKILNAELDHTSDRSCAIVAASMIDDLLAEAIRGFLLLNVTAQDPLFDGPNALLGTLSARIDLAHRLGLISSRLARDLHIIRKIRNDSAHVLDGGSFEMPNVRSWTAELVLSQNLSVRAPFLLTAPYDTIRGNFVLVVALVVIYLDELVHANRNRLAPATGEWLYTCEWQESIESPS